MDLCWANVFNMNISRMRRIPFFGVVSRFREGFRVWTERRLWKCRGWLDGQVSQVTPTISGANESEGQFSCFLGQPHLICPTFQPHLYSSFARGYSDIAWWWNCTLFQTLLNCKLSSACRPTFRCFDPTQAELGADCPRLVCVFSNYPNVQKYFPSFYKAAGVPETWWKYL